MTRPFVHLHVHTEYSLLDGAIRTKALAAKVSEWEKKAVAMTDHGVMYGTVEFYENCKAAGVNPIIGCETYVDSDGYRSREKKGKHNHLILLAENITGYHNLVKLVSVANTDGFYYKPRIDHELLAEHHEGLIASSACLAGEIAQCILHNNENEARNLAATYQDIMGKGNFYLEIMPNSLPEQKKVNEALIKLSREMDIPLIATCDAHYLNKEDFEWHKILLRVNTHADKADGSFGFSDNDYYLKSPEEMEEFFGEIAPDALTNTADIADRCNVELELSTGHYKLPDLKLGEGVSLEDELMKQARAGLRERIRVAYPETPETVPEEYTKRLEYELGVITKMGFSAYFLIVSGIIKAAKERHIPIGPGRGSAAGSLVAWSLKITELDPLKFNLLFERFLNPERISMPDIDTDVSDKGRTQLLKYIAEHYGIDKVAQIITFGRMKSRQSVKDVGRALDIEYSLMDKAAKLIPPDAKSVKQAIESTPELAELAKQDERIQNVLDIAGHMEGLARHASQHAAGLVIAPVPVTDLVPVQRIKSSGSSDTDSDSDISQVVIQFTMEPVEKLGLVKMDFLGLSTLSILEEAVENIRLNQNKSLDLMSIALDDKPTYKILQEADTMGVFQLESDGIRNMLRKLKIDCFDDLIAALAMYRPGPLDSGMVDQYIKCKHGEAQPTYPHPMLEGVLKDTYGVILYQEQVMQCASVLAGYTLGEADLLRRAMGKKKVEVMQKQREKFLKGAAEKGINSETAENVFNIIEKFAGYGFNKSHSAAYALVAYQTAWLKANYQVEFMASYLTSQMKAKKDVLGHYVREVRRSGLEVLPPDINSSMESFTAVGNVIRFGLGAVSRVGHNAVDAIISARKEGGKFKSLWDFMKRVDRRELNRSILENLIKAGAFDEIDNNRARHIAALDSFIEATLNLALHSDQLSLFAEMDDKSKGEDDPALPDVPDYDIYERLELEKDVTGLYISGHPFDTCEAEIAKYADCRVSELTSKLWINNSLTPKIGGILLSVTEKRTKKGDIMSVMQLEDSESCVTMVAFPRTWAEIKPKGLTPGLPCIVEGKLDDREQLIIEKLTLLTELREQPPYYVRIAVQMNLVRTNSDNSDGKQLDVKAVARALNDCRGRKDAHEAQVLFELRGDNGSSVIRLSKTRVDPFNPERIRQSLAKVIPEEAIVIAIEQPREPESEQQMAGEAALA